MFILSFVTFLAELKESIARTSVSVEQMYCDPLLQQVGDQLGEAGAELVPLLWVWLVAVGFRCALQCVLKTRRFLMKQRKDSFLKSCCSFP